MNYTLWYERFFALSLREKVMVTLAGLFVVLYGGYVLVIEPAASARDQFIQRTLAQQAELDATADRLQNTRPADPNSSLRQRKADLQDQLQQLEKQLESQTSALIPAPAMKKVLQALLAESQQLKVIELSSIAPVRIQAVDAATPDMQQAAPGVYRHGIRLVLEGEYFQIRDYLQRLEALPWRFFWQAFDYQVLEHPRARLTLELGTLSTGKAFLGV